MSELKTKTVIATGPLPVWCHSCYIRIAPYDRRTAHQGKEYHSSCFTKINSSSKSGRR
jgi:hypothetical protein